MTLTTIKDQQRTALVTIYRKNASGEEVELKQYSVSPIAPAPAGDPKIVLEVTKKSAFRAGIALSLDERPFAADTIRIPGAARRAALILIGVLLLLLLIAGVGALINSLRTRETAVAAVETGVKPVAEVKDEPEPDTSPTIETPAVVKTPPALPPPEPFEELVYFAPDSALLDEAARQGLTELLPVLRRSPEAKLTILGHCASRGTEEGRLALSRQRAAVVADFLRQKGINVEPDQVEGIGARKPATRDEESQYLNRRVEIRLEGE